MQVVTLSQAAKEMVNHISYSSFYPRSRSSHANGPFPQQLSNAPPTFLARTTLRLGYSSTLSFCLRFDLIEWFLHPNALRNDICIVLLVLQLLLNFSNQSMGLLWRLWLWLA